jgi:ribonuclease R
MRGVLVEGGVGTPYPDDAVADARAAAVEPDGLDDGRVDLRDLITLTVDPPDARDFDDAISVVADGDALVVFVHIADVAFHVRPGTALDVEASRRAFSVYVPGRVEPMLPPELSNGACSLRQDHDRRAVTVELRFDAAMEPGEPRFQRTLIRSDARLDYTEAHEILEGAATTRSAAVVETLRLAERVSVELRRRRFARGALEIEAHELAFELEDGRVVGARRDEEPRAHSLVEELMILANEQVAELLARRKLPALYRVHRAPDAESIVAAAIRDHMRGAIVGTRTFGKGSLQSVEPLANGAALKLTIAEYRTPKGRDLHGRGVLPTIEATPKQSLSLALRAVRASRLGH